MPIPFVSVVIPAYNMAVYVAEALDSVFRQSFTDYEVIVVDDGSTDSTREIVGRYGARVTYFYQPNQGLAVARNSGLRLSAGEYVTYLDADDVWESDNLLVKVHALRAVPCLGGVFSEFSIFDNGGERHARGTRELFPFFARTGRTFDDVFRSSHDLVLPDGRHVRMRHGEVFESLFWGNFILPTSMLFNRAFAEAVGPFRPELRTQQDYEYWLRFTKHHPLAYVDDVLVRYRRHPAQLTDYSRIENIFLAIHRIIDQYEGEFAARGRHDQWVRRKVELLTELAKVYAARGRGGEARARIREALRRDRSYLPAYMVLAASLVPPAMLKALRGR